MDVYNFAPSSNHMVEKFQRYIPRPQYLTTYSPLSHSDNSHQTLENTVFSAEVFQGKNEFQQANTLKYKGRAWVNHVFLRCRLKCAIVLLTGAPVSGCFTWTNLAC